MPVMFHTGVAPPFDIFSLSRSLTPFYRDLFKITDKVKAAVEVGTDAMIKLGITNAKRAKGNRIAIFATRSSASFLSPKLFDEISFPSLKRMIEAYHGAGLDLGHPLRRQLGSHAPPFSGTAPGQLRGRAGRRHRHPQGSGGSDVATCA